MFTTSKKPFECPTDPCPHHPEQPQESHPPHPAVRVLVELWVLAAMLSLPVGLWLFVA